MKKGLKIALIFAALGIVTAALVFQFVINKSHPDYEKEKAELSISAQDLFEMFRENSSLASTTYNGKVIEIEGQLTEIESNDDQTFACFVLDEGMFGAEGVRISMLANHADRLKTISKGQTIVIKGYVTGYNDTDVIVEFGSIKN